MEQILFKNSRLRNKNRKFCIGCYNEIVSGEIVDDGEDFWHESCYNNFIEKMYNGKNLAGAIVLRSEILKESNTRGCIVRNRNKKLNKL